MMFEAVVIGLALAIIRSFQDPFSVTKVFSEMNNSNLYYVVFKRKDANMGKKGDAAFILT